ncbi:MAG: hypothetical protein H6R13_3011 [Proteobacteria bacterium]|nr:hypothetical protein [Pseudomonadota bacterium]
MAFLMVIPQEPTLITVWWSFAALLVLRGPVPRALAVAILVPPAFTVAPIKLIPDEPSQQRLQSSNDP